MGVNWTKELFDLAYNLGAEPEGHPNDRPEIRLGYNRAVMYPMCQRRAQFFNEHFKLDATTPVVVVGAAFGWTVEALGALGVPVVGTDISEFVHGRKDTSEDEDIVRAIQVAGLDPTKGEGLKHFGRLRNGGVRTRGVVLNETNADAASRSRVRAALKNKQPALVISEDVMTSLTDQEALTLRAQMAEYGAPLCHFVTENANPEPPFSFNSKDIAGWKALFLNDTIVADGTYKVL